jgi:prepilin-type N-terminal cleavage/methylation domain-containing protein
MKWKSGYTLIEILVGLTIVGLLFGVGYANFRAFSQRRVVIDAAKNLQGDLRLTQGMAIAGQKPDDPACNSPTNTLNGYYFNILSETSYEIRASCSGGIPGAANKTITLNNGALFASPFPSPNPILFKVIGQGTNIPEGQNVVIKMVQAGTTNESSVTISSGGQIQ